MALKAILDSIEDLDDGLKSEYAEKEIDGKKVFVLQIEGVQTHPDVKALKTALDRQKNDNKTLKTEKATLEAKLVDFPEEFTLDEWHRLQALDIDPEDPEGKAKKKQKDDERLAAAKKQYEQQIEALKKQNTDLQTKYDNDISTERKGRAEDRAETQLTEALTKAGVKTGLMGGAKRLLKDLVKHEVEDDGSLRVFVATDMGEQEIGAYVETWSKSDEGKEYIAPASGGGADGNKKPGGAQGGGENPFLPAAWNKTKQGQLLNSDRGKAERFAKSAGFANLDVAIKAVRANTTQ